MGDIVNAKVARKRSHNSYLTIKTSDEVLLLWIQNKDDKSQVKVEGLLIKGEPHTNLLLKKPVKLAVKEGGEGIHDRNN